MELIFKDCTKADKIISMRLRVDEYEHIKEMADRYCMGNVSHWIRKASSCYKPKKSELMEI